jgi:hypothetical protein
MTIYFALRDAGAEKHGLLRIVDEPGENFLYSQTRQMVSGQTSVGV